METASYPSRTRHPSYTATSARPTTTASTRVSSSPQPSLPAQSQPYPPQQTPHLTHRFHNGIAKRASPAPSSSTDSSSSRFRRPPHASMSTEEPMSAEARPSLTASSNYLQEKLLKERKVESERCASPSIDTRATQSSPARPPYTISRPKSSGGLLDAHNKKKGVGLKEMEQTLTNLHKQNFDLKLELYHRRERQTALEERCETLETEKHDLQDINDKLLSELEMRDKAVEEAVAMIVSLEAHLEQLLHEREVSQHQADQNHFFATDAELRKALSSVLQSTTGAFSSTASLDDTTPRAKHGKAAKMDNAATLTAAADDAPHTINRMPSFISDRSERTENLRNVYLDRRGASVVSLPRMSEENSDVDFRDAANRIASPTLSVLSESSFMSIYGNKQQQQQQQLYRLEQDAERISASTPRPQRPMSPVACVPDIALSRTATERRPSMNRESNDNAAAAPAAVRTLAGISTTPSATTGVPSRSRSSRKTDTPTKKRSGSVSCAAGGGPANLNTLADLLGTNSPLQRLEKMEKSLQAMNEASRPGSQEDGSGVAAGDIGALTRHLHSQDFGAAYARQQKKDALRRVRTDAPFGRDPMNPHNLPPTPDTISTSTLRRYKNSSDTLCLSQDKEATHEASYPALSGEPKSRSTSGGKRLSSLDSSIGRFPQTGAPSTTAFDSRLDEMGGGGGGGGLGKSNNSSRAASFFESPLNIPARPRSADETTLSHRRHSSVWGDSDNSSDDDMDLDGNDSASLHDYWLRESLRPTGHPPPNTKRSSNRSRRHGRVSPDLFSFPTTSNGWATTAMFGTLGGQGYHGSLGAGTGAGSAPLAQTLDALGDSLPTPTAGWYGGVGGGALGSPLPYGMSAMQDGPPPPPNRRSSLHARTGSKHGTPSRSVSRQGTAPGTPSIDSSSATFSNVRRSPTRKGDSRGQPTQPPADFASQSQSQSQAQGYSEVQSTILVTPQEQTVVVKQRHYPPASGTNGGGGAARNRVLSLFRRSGSQAQTQDANANTSAKASSASSDSTGPGIAAPSSAPATETTFSGAATAAAVAAAAANKASGGRASPALGIGMPSRVRHRSELDDEGAGLSSSTPPPILRNPRMRGHARRESVEAGGAGGGGGSSIGSGGGGGGGAPTGHRAQAQAQEDQDRAEAATSAAAVVEDTDDVGGVVLGPDAETAQAQQTGARKKWLLGRVAGLRNRAG